MVTIKIIIAAWVALTAVWMIAQDIQIERMRKRLDELERGRNVSE